MKSHFKVRLVKLCVVMLACGLPLAASQARAADDITPGESAGATIVPKADAQVPLDLAFKDEEGRTVKLGDYFHPNRPVLLTMVYFGCTGLCNFTLNGITDDLRKLDLKPGKDFEIIAVSFDPKEGPEMAAGKKANYIKSLGKPEVAPGWHFLTSSDPAAARTLGEAIGFGYKLNPNFAKDPAAGEYLHSTGIFICTPEGRVSRVQQGITTDVDVLHDSLIHATQGKISSGLFGVALACGLYHFDPATGKYTRDALNIMRAAGLTTLLALTTGIGWMLYQEKRKKTNVELST